MRFKISLAVLLTLLFTPVHSHELWIDPDDYSVEVGTDVTARLVNGQNFDGVALRYFPTQFVRFTLSLGEEELPVPGRVGDAPALNMPALGDGLHIATYQSSGDFLRYNEIDKFIRFADHKDLSASLGTDVRARHAERKLPDSGFWEYYTRYSKALIGVGTAEGADRRVGLETELVALTNPYADDLAGGMKVQLFWKDAPRADAQIELFSKAPDGTVTVTLHRTDASGVVILPVSPGYAYLVDAVVLREPSGITSGGREAAWETLWAALTFAVPD